MVMNREKKEYTVCLFGASLDVGNMGCRALAASLVKLILEARPDARIYLLYGNRTSGMRDVKVFEKNVKVNVVNYRLSPKAHIQEHLLWIFLAAFFYRLFPIRALRDLISKSTPMIRVIEQADVVGSISGGDSFSDIYGLRRIIIGSVPGIIAILLNKKTVLLPQTYGPYSSKIAKLIARFIFARSVRIYARDSRSIEVVRKILNKKGEYADIRMCPDVAFILDAITPDMMDIQPKIDRNNSIPLIGLNISGLLYNGGYTYNNMFGLKFEYKKFVNVLVEKFMEETNAHILLIPHVFDSGVESDYDACYEAHKSVPEKYRDRVHRVMREYNQNEIKGIIGLCDFFIGSRMHSCIAALSQAIPSVSIAYSQKFLGVFESIDLGNSVIDARERTQDEIMSHCMNHFKEKDKIAIFLKEKIPNIQSKLYSCFKEEFLGLFPQVPLMVEKTGEKIDYVTSN